MAAGRTKPRVAPVVAMFIERIAIAPFSEGAATTLTRRVNSGETDEQPRERRAAHLADVMQRRVKVRWRA